MGNALSSWRAFPGRGKYPNRSTHDTGLGQYSKDNESLDNTDAVVWMTTGTTHVARAEEWPYYADRMGTYSAETMELL
ncbi:hypothetical protein O5541_02685 [Escherichia coli]|nr:hypothetical protein [Escherichia coli]